MTLLGDTEHFLDLRLRLQQEVLGAAPAEDPHGALASRGLGAPDDRRRLVHVGVHVEHELVALERLGRHVHADRGVARRGRVHRHAVLPRRRQEGAAFQSQLVLARAQIAAAQVVELGRAHGTLELGRRDDLAEEGVRVQQDAVVEEDVVDADHALLAQLDVVHVERALVHAQAEAEVRVVVEVRARGDHPVHEAGLEQRDDRAHAEPRGGQGAGHRQPHGDVFLQHPLGEQPCALAQAGAVVGEKRRVDQVGGGFTSGDGGRVNALAAQVVARLSDSGHERTSGRERKAAGRAAYRMRAAIEPLLRALRVE